MTALLTINGEVYELTRMRDIGVDPPTGFEMTLVPFVGKPVIITLYSTVAIDIYYRLRAWMETGD